MTDDSAANGNRDRLTRRIAALEESLEAETAERKRMEEAARESQERYRSVVDNLGIGVALISPDMEILALNSRMRSWFPDIDVGARPVCYRAFNHPPRTDVCSYCPTVKVFEDGGVHESTSETPAGAEIRHYRIISSPIRDGNGKVVSAVEIVEDVTVRTRAEEDRRRLEDQLRQSQKMEAVGQLAGGVAHDFNNILTTIVGYSHITLLKMQENDPLRHHIEQILESSNRATALTQSLLAFGRKQTLNLAAIDLNDVMKRFEKFLLRLVREDIALEITCAGGPLTVMADRGQIEQATMNLVTNARDAMPNGGKLAIETRLVRLDRGFVETRGYGKAGEYALLSVSDTGTGMDEQTIARVFDPFFTTKEPGKGTGLGLSMAYGIVKEHDGFINVASEPGRGTTFEILLPIVRAAAGAQERDTGGPVPVRGGTETILLAEDDAAVRKLFMAALTQFGYSVILAVDGADAVSRFAENKDTIKLVVMDCIMPKMNGKDAFREISALNPAVNCIFMSGYAKDLFDGDGVPDRNTELVLKPLPPAALLAKIRETLDR